MSVHYVMLRCYIDFPGDFPFAKVAVKDSELPAAFAAIDKRKPVKAARQRQPRARKPTLEEWNEGAVMLPSGAKPLVAPRPVSLDWNPVTPAYPVLKVNTESQAAAAVDALQSRVHELSEAAFDSQPCTPEQEFFTFANPHIFALPSSTFTAAEAAAVRAKLKRLGQPASDLVSREEAIARLILARFDGLMAELTVRKDPGVNLEPLQPFEGDDWDELEHQPKVLLRQVRDRQDTDLNDICEHVWGKDLPDISASAVSTTISKANHFLRKREEPRTLRRVRGQSLLRWK